MKFLSGGKLQMNKRIFVPNSNKEEKIILPVISTFIEYSFDNIKDDQLLKLLNPTSDEHASKEYRLHIGPQIIRNVLINSIQNYEDSKND